MSEIRNWRDNCQENVDQISGKNYLKITCETWNPGGRPLRNKTKATTMLTDKSPPFLELEYFGTKLEDYNLKSIKGKIN